MYATFNENACTTISCHSSMNAIDETAITIFCYKISSLVKHIPKYYVQNISEDMIAHIGKD